MSKQKINRTSVPEHGDKKDIDNLSLPVQVEILNTNKYFVQKSI